MVGPAFGAGIYEKCYIASETDYGVADLAYPVGTDAVCVDEVSVTIQTDPFMRSDKKGTPATRYGGENKFNGTVSLIKDILPSGTPATDPDDIALFTSGGWKRTVSASGTVEAGSTATVINEAGHSFTAGQFVVVAMPSENQAFQMRRIASVNAGTDYTLSPALTAAPATGAAVTAVILLDINLTRDADQDSVTLHAVGNVQSTRAVGVAPSKFTFELTNEGAAKMTVEAILAAARPFIRTALNGSLAQAATSATIHNAAATGTVAKVKPTAADPYYVSIEDEVITITDGGGTTGLTVTRGALSTSDVLHADGTAILPYAPTQTVAGAPVPPVGGELFVGGTALKANTASLEATMGVSQTIAHFGDQWVGNGYKFELNGLLPIATLEASRDAGGATLSEGSLYFWAETMQARTAVEVFCYQGVTAGSLFGFRLPAARMATSELSGAEDEEAISMVWTGHTDGSNTTPVQLLIG